MGSRGQRARHELPTVRGFARPRPFVAWRMQAHAQHEPPSPWDPLHSPWGPLVSSAGWTSPE